MPAEPFPTESYSEITDCPCSDHDCPRLVRHVFVWDAPPVTMNAAHNGRANRWRMNETIAEWRGAFRLMAAGCQRLAWCTITVDHLTATRRLADCVACAPSYKAALDGLRDWKDDDGAVHLGVLPDDSPEFVRAVKFNAPVYAAGRDALILTLDGPAAIEQPTLLDAARHGRVRNAVDTAPL